jgi:tRNA(His) 5'-end guanylyltransferase
MENTNSSGGGTAMTSSKDPMGDRMKEMERVEAGRRFLPGLPIVARLDGKCFSGYTRGMQRPFDERLTRTMREVTRYLVEKTNARIGYTQSDEITLVYCSDDPKSQVFYDGKIQKMVSVLASMATARFAIEVEAAFGREMPMALFDCRVFAVPSHEEATNQVLWRELDASKNSVSMLARHHFSHKSLQSLTAKQMQEKLFSEAGVNWNDQPDFFKRGTFLQRRSVEKMLSPEELERIPEAHRPPAGVPVRRTEVRELAMPRFSTVANRVEVIFDGAEPKVAS